MARLAKAKRCNHAMIEFYLPIKAVHIFAVIFSGLIFFIRGLLLLNNKAWAMSAPIRYTSYGVDTVLLTAALMLATMLPSAMFANGWLWLKIGLLLVYIVLGSFALKRGRNRQQRALCFIAALMVYGYMMSVARAHHPLGFLLPLFS